MKRILFMSVLFASGGNILLGQQIDFPALSKIAAKKAASMLQEDINKQLDSLFSQINLKYPQEIQKLFADTLKSSLIYAFLKKEYETIIPNLGFWYTAANYDKSGKRLAVALNDGKIEIWNTNNKEVIKTIRLHGSAIKDVKFNYKGDKLMILTEENLLVWDLDNDAQMFEINSPNDIIEAASFSPQDKYIALGLNSGKVKIYDAKTGQFFYTFESAEQDAPANSVNFSPDGKFLAVASADSAVYIWDIEQKTIIKRLEGHEGPVIEARFSPSGHLIASISNEFEDSTTKIWNAENGKEVKSFELSGYGLSIEFGPSEQTLLTNDSRGIQIWDIQSGKIIAAFETDPRSSKAVFSPDAKNILTANYNKITIWGIDNDSLPFQLLLNYIQKILNGRAPLIEVEEDIDPAIEASSTSTSSSNKKRKFGEETD